VSVIASNCKYGSCLRGTRFQSPNQFATLYLGENSLKLIIASAES